MPVLFKIQKLLLEHFVDLRWQGIALSVIAYMLLSWVLLWLFGETALTSSHDFFYWIMVTASTVGYGDLSPSTTGGKYVVSFFVIPFGLGLFGLAIGRMATFVSYQWRKGVLGLKNLNYHNHIVVVGWNEARTLQLLRLLLRETTHQREQQKVVLCVRAEMENPMPDAVGFTKVLSFSHDEDMARAGINEASCIIIDNPDDDVTLSTALYCSAQNPDAHIIAYFQDEKLGKILKQHCPNVECMPSVAVEMIAKSAVDPGSSALHHELLAVDNGMTQYSIRYSGQQALPVKSVFSALKKHHEATLIGVSNNEAEGIQLNPSLDSMIEVDANVYYIADERIEMIDWDKLQSEQEPS